MMNYYLIDLENVRKNGFLGIESLSEKDRVIIFYSDHADSIPIDLHFQINASPAKFEFRKVMVGSKNALDFQLCSHLGYLISYALRWKKTSSFYIVSNDAGYNVLINYWKDFDVSVYRVANFAKNVICQDDGIAEDDESADLATAVMDIVQDKSVASEILSFAGVTNDSHILNTFLTRMYNNETTKAGEIYRAVKKTIGKPSWAAEVIKLL